MLFKDIFSSKSNVKFLGLKKIRDAGKEVYLLKNLFTMKEISALHEYSHDVYKLIENKTDVCGKTRNNSDLGEVVIKRIADLKINGKSFTSADSEHHFIFMKRGFGVVGQFNEDLMGEWCIVVPLFVGLSKILLENGLEQISPKSTTGILIHKSVELDFGVDTETSRDYILINLNF